MNCMECFPNFTTPSAFVDGMSYQEQLACIKKYIETEIDNIKQAIGDVPNLQEKVTELEKSLQDLIARVDGIVSGDTILQLVKEKINECVKFVFFGLTDNGYFCAYIPDSWDGITFDTISDCSSENYGKLVIKY